MERQLDRNEDEKRKLREHALNLISGKANLRLAPDETTGENDFKYEQWPKVCGVVVDKGSGYGYVQISTVGGKDTEINKIHTGRQGDRGYVFAEISTGQS
ncbi:hypothetical protein KXV57_003450, partial [Aspergillus fumigatus]